MSDLRKATLVFKDSRYYQTSEVFGAINIQPFAGKATVN